MCFARATNAIQGDGSKSLGGPLVEMILDLLNHIIAVKGLRTF